MATLLSVADGSIAYPSGNRVPRLDELESLRVIAPADPAQFHQIAERSTQALRLIESNSLHTADEFLRVSKCVAVTDSAFRSTRVRYELILCAAALGSDEARHYLAGEWDRLQRTLGRPVRFGASRGTPIEALTEMAPTCVREILRDPALARASAQTRRSDAELIQLADLTVPGAVGSASGRMPTSSEKVAQLRSMVDAGRVVTSEDFKNAALVMHRGGDYGGYVLAHEFALCAWLLESDGDVRWLVAATYDRMLRSAGHDQRFGTQYVGFGGIERLARIDTAGISNRQRQALGCAPIGP